MVQLCPLLFCFWVLRRYFRYSASTTIPLSSHETPYRARQCQRPDVRQALLLALPTWTRRRCSDSGNLACSANRCALLDPGDVRWNTHKLRSLPEPHCGATLLPDTTRTPSLVGREISCRVGYREFGLKERIRKNFGTSNCTNSL